MLLHACISSAQLRLAHQALHLHLIQFTFRGGFCMKGKKGRLLHERKKVAKDHSFDKKAFLNPAGPCKAVKPHC